MIDQKQATTLDGLAHDIADAATGMLELTATLQDEGIMKRERREMADQFLKEWDELNSTMRMMAKTLRVDIIT